MHAIAFAAYGFLLKYMIDKIMFWSCNEPLVFVLHLGSNALLNFLPGIDIELLPDRKSVV